MSYRVRFTTQTGATFYWERTFATRTGATHSAQLQADSKGYTFAVEELPEPGSTAAPKPAASPDAPAIERSEDDVPFLRRKSKNEGKQ